jgi:hypothetical protein
MADDADRAQQDTEVYMSNLKTNYEIPQGKAGDCEICGEWYGRLIQGICAPCRDKYKLP